ncbi:adenylate cyclase, terminal-differentiation specific-like [Strongylocentrotus purpuratus]|uniref:Retrotransposon gag domain-containing protein n=1 Tax=Strongylocentrotus purpuratus TaxID=7668 RepID=A0A7M7NNC5_STRPU|nr:adenylate cyclase, terminal-differentiation specific-like [Strongylocentrotus purpuratus]
MPSTDDQTTTTSTPPNNGTTMPRHTTLRSTDFLPSRFTGDRLNRDDSTAHFLTFDDYLDAHDVDSTDRDQFPTILRTFRRTLQGQARLWIDGLTFSTYTDLKDAFVRRFSPAKSSYSHVRDFNTMTMTDGESAEAFLQRLRLTATYIDYGETQIKHRLLDSIPDDCRAAILMSASAPDLSADEIAAKAQLFLDLRQDTTRQTKELTFSTQTDIDDLRQQLNALKTSNATDNENDRGRPPHRRPSTPTRTSRSASADQTHRDHYQQTRQDRSHDRNRDLNSDRRGKSPYRREQTYNQRPRMVCNYCYFPGHVWRDCRRRLRDEERQPSTPYHNYRQPQQHQNQRQQPQHQRQQYNYRQHQQQTSYGPRPQDF